MKFIFGGVSSCGAVRTVNQDRIGMLCEENKGLFFVADGMGGHRDGSLASDAILTQLSSWWTVQKAQREEQSFTDAVESVKQELSRINHHIWYTYNQGQVCGSTVVILYIQNNKYAVISAGDSRIYHLKKKKIHQLTIDDVWENQPDVQNRFSPENIAKSPNRGKLVRAIGVRQTVGIRLFTDEISKKESFLLCSDGLYRACSEEFMQRELLSVKNDKSLNKALQSLEKQVYWNGAPDNVSVILVKVK